MIDPDEPLVGEVAPEVADEHPELRLWWLPARVPGRRSPPEVVGRLQAMSNRLRGAQALALRSQPIPHAYRVFFRQIGLDPDVHRVPIEAVVVERLRAGEFKPYSWLQDAVTIAVMETHVPVWALDATGVRGPLRVRPAVAHEPLGRRDERAPWLPEGRLVIADDEGPLAVLFGDVAPGHLAGPKDPHVVLFSLSVAGVPLVSVAEALWTVTDTLEPGA